MFNGHCLWANIQVQLSNLKYTTSTSKMEIAAITYIMKWDSQATQKRVSSKPKGLSSEVVVARNWQFVGYLVMMAKRLICNCLSNRGTRCFLIGSEPFYGIPTWYLKAKINIGCVYKLFWKITLDLGRQKDKYQKLLQFENIWTYIVNVLTQHKRSILGSSSLDHFLSIYVW